jgi:hypothetical protein
MKGLKDKIVNAYWWCYRIVIYSHPFLTFKAGVQNLIYFFPIIWRDRDWDDTYLTRLMAHKLKRMEKSFEKYSMHKYVDRDIKNIRMCRILCERISEDEYYERNYPWRKVNGKFIDNNQNDVDLLCDIMKKHLREWWY